MTRQKKLDTPIIVGITGNIGSGKTTICELFTTLFNIPVFSADRVGKILLEEDQDLRIKIKYFFGQDTYIGTSPNTKLLAERVFKNPKSLQKINELVHPRIKIYFANWLKEKNETLDILPYVIKESALIFESKIERTFDKIILVCCPQEERKKRVLMSRGMSIKDFSSRNNRQWSEEMKSKNCDYIINNSKNIIENIKIDVKKIHYELVALYFN